MTADTPKVSQRAAKLARGQELAEAIASALGTSLRHYMPATKEKAVETATMFLAKVEGALSPSQNDGLIEALERPWSWPCAEGGPHCCCECDDCCDCDRPRSITPDWTNAETCIENVLEAYSTSLCDENGPVDTVVSSGDLYVLLSLAGAAYHARKAGAL